MKYFVQFSIICLICLIGEIVSKILPFPFPSSVAGMIILFVLLVTKLLKPAHIRETAVWLQNNMALFFVPVFVTVLESWNVLKNVFFQVFIICIVTTLTTFTVTAYTVKTVTKLQNRLRGEQK